MSSNDDSDFSSESPEKKKKLDIAGSTEWPLHPRNTPKIAKVGCIRGFRQNSANLQFMVTENGTNYDWLNGTDFFASSSIRRYFALQIDEDKDKLQPKPYKLVARERNHYIEQDCYVPKNIVAELQRGDDELYLVEDEQGRRIIITKEIVKQKYYYLLEEYSKTWIPFGQFDRDADNGN